MFWYNLPQPMRGNELVARIKYAAESLGYECAITLESPGQIGSSGLVFEAAQKTRLHMVKKDRKFFGKLAKLYGLIYGDNTVYFTSNPISEERDYHDVGFNATRGHFEFQKHSREGRKVDRQLEEIIRSISINAQSDQTP